MKRRSVSSNMKLERYGRRDESVWKATSWMRTTGQHPPKIALHDWLTVSAGEGWPLKDHHMHCSDYNAELFILKYSSSGYPWLYGSRLYRCTDITQILEPLVVKTGSAIMSSWGDFPQPPTEELWSLLFCLWLIITRKISHAAEA